MIIRLKDGSEKEYAQPMSVLDIAKDISEGLARNACAGQVNGETVDLRTVVSENSDLNILTFNDEEGKLAFRHTASHVLAQAVKRLTQKQSLQSDQRLKMDFTMTLTWHHLQEKI